MPTATMQDAQDDWALLYYAAELRLSNPELDYRIELPSALGNESSAKVWMHKESEEVQKEEYDNTWLTARFRVLYHIIGCHIDTFRECGSKAESVVLMGRDLGITDTDSWLSDALRCDKCLELAKQDHRELHSVVVGRQ